MIQYIIFLLVKKDEILCSIQKHMHHLKLSGVFLQCNIFTVIVFKFITNTLHYFISSKRVCPHKKLILTKL